MMNRFSSYVAIWLFLATASSFAFAANNEPVKVLASEAAELKTRFRIDHMVDSLVLVVQRNYGTAPVVVGLPDGSKWYSSRHPSTVKWVDGVAGDMIYIEKPIPGPWQLVGDIIEGSTIRKLSKLDIQVDPLPQPLFQGERLKVTARMIGDDLLFRMPGLEYMVEWTTRFSSKQIPGEDNFATGTIIVGAYQDNGEELDEVPDDGIFTGRTNLDQPAGQYNLTVTARNNILERDFVMPFVLSKQPIVAEMIEPDDPLNGIWHLHIVLDLESILITQTHLEFELVGPAGLQIPINLQDLATSELMLPLPKVAEFGSYRVKGSAVSTTVGGREIVLTLPEMFFNLVEPPIPPPSAEELAAKAAAIAALQEAKAKEDAIFWIILVNSILFVSGIVGVIGFMVWRKKKNLANALAQAEARLGDGAGAGEAKTNKSKDMDLDDIDLTIPEDKG